MISLSEGAEANKRVIVRVIRFNEAIRAAEVVIERLPTAVGRVPFISGNGSDSALNEVDGDF